MGIHVYKYGMRLRPYGPYSQPGDGFACVGRGGTVDGSRYHNFVYYIDRLDGETEGRYGLDYLGATYLKAEEM